MQLNGFARLAGVGALLCTLVSDIRAQDPMAGMVMSPAPLGISMDRAGSGTTWTPDAVRLPSVHFMMGQWEAMLHGFVFGQYIHQSGDRGDSQLGSLNWGMFMAAREVAGGRFQVRTMLSLDPWTVTAKGYPLLLQSGETYEGKPLHDRQHPHDFWMELAAMYERELTSSVGVSLYAGPSGEPALGPVAFMHRPSAMDNPLAPLSHHWQDATHIVYGVITTGLFGRRWKLEGSVFNGREPDERRWNIEPIRLDSYSGRLTVNPSANWSGTVGYGYMKSPEILHPDEPMHRVTASLMHGRALGSDGQMASTFVYGGNKHDGDHLSSSFLFESEAVLNRRSTLLGRMELITKNAAELVVNVPPTNFDDHEEFNVATASLGYIHEVAKLSRATVGLGVLGAVNVVPSALESTYGSRTPFGATVFLRLRPSFSPRAAATGHMHH